MSPFSFYFPFPYSYHFIFQIPFPHSNYIILIHTDICSIHQTCVDCTGTNLCYWSNISTCATVADMDTINNNTVVLDASQCEQQPLLKCDQFRDCVSCQASSCVWNNASRCVSSDNGMDNTVYSGPLYCGHHWDSLNCPD